ncbi:MAG: hypothetical protein ACK4GL_09660 [Flavobacteriales bacterium]
MPGLISSPTRINLERIRPFENFHIFLWLLKDVCWIADFKIAGLIMAIPAVLLACIITWLHRKDLTELLHNLAVCCWIIANVIWMVGEFFFDDGTRPFALIFFTIGMLLVAYHYLYRLPIGILRKH